MKKQISTLHRTLLATGVAMGLGLSQTALAAEGEGELEILAGLTDALILNCDQPLNFGTIVIPDPDSYDDEALIEVTWGGDTSVSYGPEDVVIGTDAAPGRCTLTGSVAENGTGVTVTVNGEAYDGSFDDIIMQGDGDAYADLDAPNDAAALSIVTFDIGPSNLQITDGAATIHIGGYLEIPQEVDADAMGGYSVEVTIGVEEDDT